MKLIDYKKKYELSKSEKDRKIYFMNCYKIFFDCNLYEGELEDRALYEGVSSKEILDATRVVMIKYLNLSEEDFFYSLHLKKFNLERTEKRKVKDVPTYNLLVQLLGVTDEDKICKLIEDSGLKPHYIKSKITVFVDKYYYDKLFLEQVLRNKIEIYLKKCDIERKRKKTEVLLEANKLLYSNSRQLIEEFLESNYLNVNDFCCDKKISLEYFNICISVVEKIDVNFYITYLTVLEYKKKIESSLVNDKLNMLLYYLTEGRDEFMDKFDRNIDLLDYYQFIGLDIDSLYKILDRLNYSSVEIKKLKSLVYREVLPKKDIHPLSEKEVIDIIMQGVKEIDCKKDRDGNLIPGTGRIVDSIEKEQIINFLQYYNVPINLKNYRLAFNRYIRGTLFVEDTIGDLYKEKKLKRGIVE